MTLTLSGHSCYVCMQRNYLLKYEYERPSQTLNKGKTLNG